VGRRQTLLAVEGGPVARNDAANLVCRPVTDQVAACLLKQIGVARIEADATCSSVCALRVGVALDTSSRDPLVVI